MLEPGIAQERALSRGVVVEGAKGRREQAQSRSPLRKDFVPLCPYPVVLAADCLEAEAVEELNRDWHRRTIFSTPGG